MCNQLATENRFYVRDGGLWLLPLAALGPHLAQIPVDLLMLLQSLGDHMCNNPSEFRTLCFLHIFHPLTIFVSVSVSPSEA